MSALLLPVLLCLVSAVAYAGAAVVQERVAATAPGGPCGPLRRPGWWGAVALTGLGAGLHVVALAYGPLSLVQPLGALTIVFALPMAALAARRPVGAAGWRGALLATAGLAGLLTLTGPPHAESLDAGRRPGLAALALAAAAVLALGARWARRAVVRGVVLAAAAGTAYGMASVLTKAAAQDWTSHATDFLAFTVPATVVLAAAGMLLSQASYRGAGLAAPLATVTTVNPVVAAAVGTAVLGETFRYGVAGGLLAVLAGAVATAGVITLSRLTPDRADARASAGTPAIPGARRRLTHAAADRE
ncbi:DMT family transporter [Streptomyces sp. URMC 124]|uniref:DMT family transporter n=1 Tax=Streptomyces sp. URMC 124 TaxID=3423405 RepID=UPI003F19E14A